MEKHAIQVYIAFIILLGSTNDMDVESVVLGIL